MNVVPKLNEEVRASFQPSLMASGQSKGVSWKVVGVDGARKGLEEEGGGSSTPRYKVVGEVMGKALNSSPKANFGGEQRGLQSMLRPRVVGVGKGWWLRRGRGII